MSERKRWWQRKVVQYPAGAFAVLFVIVAILQGLNIIDTPEETRQTETAVALAGIIQTETAVASITPSATATATATETQPPTVTATQTPIPTETGTPTNTLPPSETPQPTNTLPPSETPQPTATSSPEDVARQGFVDTFGPSRGLERVIVNDMVVTIRFPLTNLSARSARFEAQTSLVELVCNLREAGLTGRNYQITGTIAVIDSRGNESAAEGVEMILDAGVIEQINCENQVFVELADIAERYDLSPLLAE